jgi:hypothetical protein
MGLGLGGRERGGSLDTLRYLPRQGTGIPSCGIFMSKGSVLPLVLGRDMHGE